MCTAIVTRAHVDYAVHSGWFRSTNPLRQGEVMRVGRMYSEYRRVFEDQEIAFGSKLTGKEKRDALD